MSKGTAIKDNSKNESIFKLTFAIEIIGFEVWHDCNEGWLDLGPCNQGLKLQYQLSPGYSYDVDILIWPHTAKIWCSGQYGWVRTWQFLDRRWLTFSIRHVLPVSVLKFRQHVVNVFPTFGMGSLSAAAKNDKNREVYLPPISFGTKRYFAPVIDEEESLGSFIQRILWEAVVVYVPSSMYDGVFNMPHPVSDVRHQDAILERVKYVILNDKITIEILPEKLEKSPKGKDKEKKKETVKFGLTLPGETILAGTGRISTFGVVGEKPQDFGEIIALISTQNLPAEDDFPIMFVNINKLFDTPVEKLNQYNISHLYAKWTINGYDHSSEPIAVTKNQEVDFNDHHILPFDSNSAGKISTPFLEYPFEIQLRGLITSSKRKADCQLFGFGKDDSNYDKRPPPKLKVEDTDVVIAVTKIDASQISKGLNTFIRGEYPLYPPHIEVKKKNRESFCTNDINAIGASMKPVLVVPNYVILEAQMTLEASIGIVGCRPPKLFPCFSRFWCLITETDIAMKILEKITEINRLIVDGDKRENLLTGFSLDTGDVVFLFIEGPRDGKILSIWELTENYYPNLKPIFSSSSRYASRIYPESAGASFIILKMFAPLSSLLACPSAYIKPAMPIPTKLGLLKLSKLISMLRNRSIPHRKNMPDINELQSFKLELCVPPYSIPLTFKSTDRADIPNSLDQSPAYVNDVIIQPDTEEEINVTDNENTCTFSTINIYYNIFCAISFATLSALIYCNKY